MNLKEIVCTIVLLASFAMGSAAPAHAQKMDGFPDVPYLLVDTANGGVLAANRSHDRWHPASLTKMMTAYVAFRALASGEIEPGSPVTFTTTALNAPPSRMGYAKGTALRFDSALTILIVKSANDMALAIAESLSGTVEDFVSRMNQEASRLGMDNTVFVNPHGLHSSAQYTSAADMAILARAIQIEFPQYIDVFAIPTIETGKRQYTSYNLLLERFEGTTGMKTGFVCSAGYNIVASAERTGRKLIAVVLGTSSQTERAELAARLLLSGFQSSVPGMDLASLDRPASPQGPFDLRGKLCTEAARKARYDPASESAVIESRWLHPRKVTRQPVVVSTGGIDADPSPAWMARAFRPARVPIPLKRPEYAVVDVDGNTPGSSQLLRGTIPLPSPSPLSVQ